MRRFIALAHKEWRDVRTLTWASMLLVPALALGVRWILGEQMAEVWQSSPNERHYAEGFIPFVVAFYGMFIASDLVGGEVASRRMDGLALLPVAPARLWLAKTVHLVVATSLFAVWTFVAQAAVVLAIDGGEQAGWVLADTLQGLWVAVPVVGFALCVHFASSLGLRGVASCLVGGMVAGLLLAAVTVFPLIWAGEDLGSTRGAWLDPEESALVSAVTLLLPSLVATWTIARAGRVHLARWLRPVGIGFGVFLATLAVPAAVLAHEATTLVPGGGWAEVNNAEASPDGRFVAMTIVNRANVGVVVCDVATGEIREVADRATTWPQGGWLPASNWTPDGNLIVSRWITEAGFDELVIEPATGRVVETRPVSRDESRRRWDARRAAWEKGRWQNASQKVVGKDEARRWHATLKGPDKAAFAVESFARVELTDDSRGVVWCPDADRVVMRSLADGTERVVLTRPGAFGNTPQGWGGGLRSFHDGRTLFVRTPSHAWLVDVTRGTVRDLHVTTVAPEALRTARSERRLVVFTDDDDTPPGRRALRSDKPKSTLLDLDTGVEVRLSLATDSPSAGSELPGGRLVVRSGGGSVFVLDRELKVEKVLVGE